MRISNKQDAIHKAWLYRILSAICEDAELARVLYFKGGTCAAMQNTLNRFSIDLDFDYVGDDTGVAEIRKRMEKIFNDLDLIIKDSSKKVPQYFLKYPSTSSGQVKTGNPRIRNTIKIDITYPVPKANKYEPVRLIEIDKVINCQTIETMFANKLVALIDRFEKNNSIAGRDMYDVHYFFMQGYKYDEDVIKERRKINNIKIFFNDLIRFIEENITDTIINQDINMLLPYDEFNKIRKVLRPEVLMFLRGEIG